jgi:uncharacterized membrane protein
MEREISPESNFVTISKGVNYLGYFWNNQTESSSVLIATRSFALSEYRLYVSTSILILIQMIHQKVIRIQFLDNQVGLRENM